MSWKIIVTLPAPAKDVAALMRLVGQRWPSATVDSHEGEMIIVEVPDD